MAQQPTVVIPPPDKDPFVGTWKMNSDKSRPKPSKTDARYVFAISREGDERVEKPVSGIKINSFVIEASTTRIRCDGEWHYQARYTYPGAKERGRYKACQYIAPNLIQNEMTYDLSYIPYHPDENRPFIFGPIFYWTEEISADGQEMTSIFYKDKARTKVKETQVLDRAN